jgi:hypothetical protein
MNNNVEITFIDTESKDNGSIIVRNLGDHIGLAIFLERDGDIDIFFDNTTCKHLIEVLQITLQDIEKQNK